MAQVVCRLLTAEAWVQFLASLCEICGGHSVIGTDLYPSTSLSSDSIILQGCVPILIYRVFLLGGKENEGWESCNN